MNMHQWRKKSGLSQSQVALALGLRSKSHISRIESGAERASAEMAIAIDRLTSGEVPVAALRPDLHDVRVLQLGGAT